MILRERMIIGEKRNMGEEFKIDRKIKGIG